MDANRTDKANSWPYFEAETQNIRSLGTRSVSEELLLLVQLLNSSKQHRQTNVVLEYGASNLLHN